MYLCRVNLRVCLVVLLLVKQAVLYQSWKLEVHGLHLRLKPDSRWTCCFQNHTQRALPTYSATTLAVVLSVY